MALLRPAWLPHSWLPHANGRGNGQAFLQDQRLVATEERLAALTDELQRRGREIDELRAARRRRPWRQVATWLAVFAVALAALSAWYQTQDQQQPAQRERTAERSDLRQILQRLTALPSDAALATADTDPAARLQLLSANTTERTLLVAQAVEVAERIPDLVSSAEYRALAAAVLSVGDYEGARSYLRTAGERAATLLDKTSALRQAAVLEFAAGQEDSGRALFRDALATRRQYESSAPYTLAFAAVAIHQTWAEAELARAHCARGGQQLALAERSAQGQVVLEGKSSALSATQDALRQRVAECRRATAFQTLTIWHPARHAAA